MKWNLKELNRTTMKLAGRATTADYYVDSVTGDDTFAGTADDNFDNDNALSITARFLKIKFYLKIIE